jgi:hypothetical protein
METVVTPLSNLTSHEWESPISNISFLQTKRSYSGGYSFVFPFALSGFNDYKAKEYSNFYLTTSKAADEFIEVDSTTAESSIFLTYFKFGELYLQQNQEFTTDAVPLSTSLTPTLSTNCYFTLNLYPDNICTLSYVTNYGKKYYLATMDDQSLVYRWDFDLSFDFSTAQPHRFSYIYDSEDGEFYLIRQLGGLSAGVVTVTDATLNIATISQLNKFKLFESVVELSRPSQYKINADLNTSYIKYNGANTNIDVANSDLKLSNNFLIHSPMSDSKKNITPLKNQLALGDVFSNGQNLLSGATIQAIDGMRNYVSISNPIDSENSSEISLNYVFYNQPYIISKGITTFHAPSSMYPFSKLNVNDTKFIMAGAFAYKTPEYSDKIYKLDNVNPYSDGRQYLCTWLSGGATEQRWVDRYYYPDLIAKEDALATKKVFDVTYTNQIEALISSNVNLETSVRNYKIFDKISDLTFVPNATYEYHRFTKEVSVPNLATCDELTICKKSATCSDLAYNYQNDINNANKLTLAFYFTDTGDDWSVQSLRNLIDGGVKFLKVDDLIYFEFKIVNNTQSTTQTFYTIADYKQNDVNFVCFTFDALTGEGGFYLNNEKVLSIKTGFGEFQNDPILYGKFYYNDIDIFSIDSPLENILLNTESIDDDTALLLPILQGYLPVDDLYITLPCGMKNSIDDIAYINNICKTNSNKSNFINISVDNLGIDNAKILEELSTTIKNTIVQHVPASTTINKINFVNYL